MFILLKNLVLGISLGVSVTFMGKKIAELSLISDVKLEVPPRPVGSTATWRYIPLEQGWPFGLQANTQVQCWNIGSTHSEQGEQLNRVLLSEF